MKNLKALSELSNVTKMNIQDIPIANRKKMLICRLTGLRTNVDKNLFLKGICMEERSNW
jgi:hypothetical protein